MEIIDFIMAFIFTTFMGIFALYSSVLVHEKKTGKSVILPWEKDGFFRKTKRKIFDKSDIEYRDGDNT